MNLIIDGNAFMNVTANVALYLLKKNSNFDDPYITIDGEMILTETSRNYYRNFALGYLNGIIYPLRQSVCNVYFVFDSTSWRKTYIKNYFERNKDKHGFAYKGKRTLDDKKKQLYLFFNHFQDEVMQELAILNGLYNFKVMGAEGDDLIAFLSEKLNGNKFIWTVDHDMNQLVEYDNNIYTIVLGPKERATGLKRLYHRNLGIDTGINLVNFDVSNHGLRKFIDYMVAEKEYRSVETDPNILLYTKILCGDSSDNIPSIYTTFNLAGKAVNITPLKATKIIDEISLKYDINNIRKLIDDQDENFMNDTAKLVKKVAKTKLDVEETIKENFKFNSKIIRLSTKVIPPLLTYMMETKFAMLPNTGNFDSQKFFDLSNN